MAYIIYRKRLKAKKGVSSKMSNVVNSMFNCTPIYDKLKVKCHPDKFLDEELKAKAEYLFQELQKNRYDYNKLLELKDQIEKELIN